MKKEEIIRKFTIIYSIFIFPLAIANAEPTVKLYGHPDCPPCVKIKSDLGNRGINYETFNLKNAQVEKFYVKRFGRGVIPVAVIGDKVIRGYHPDRVLQAVREYQNDRSKRSTKKETRNEWVYGKTKGPDIPKSDGSKGAAVPTLSDASEVESEKYGVGSDFDGMEANDGHQTDPVSVQEPSSYQQPEKNTESPIDKEKSKQACIMGDSSSCFNLGLVYHREGKQSEAKKYFKFACESGVVEACRNLGVINQEEGNIEESNKFFKVACGKGDSGACKGDTENKNVSEQMYDSGENKNVELLRLGLKHKEKGNSKEAKRLFAVVCDGGEMSGCCLLGIMNEDSGNLDEAKRYYKLACHGGEVECCRFVGRVEYDKKNVSEAKRFYKIACDKGDNEGCIKLGLIDAEQGNTSDAERIFKIVCDSGDSRGCVNLGFREWKNGNIKEAKRLYGLACEMGDAGGCYFHARSEAEQGNIEKAKRLFKLSCDKGYVDGCVILSKIYGSEGNNMQAAEFFARAKDIDQGN